MGHSDEHAITHIKVTYTHCHYLGHEVGSAKGIIQSTGAAIICDNQGQDFNANLMTI